MSATKTDPKPDFDEDFLQTLKEWKEKHKIRDDDAVFLLVEMFRIHQKHWDELRQRQMPTLEQFRRDISFLTESTKSFRERVEMLIDAMAAQTPAVPVETIPLPEAKYAAATALLGGLLIGLALGKFVL